MSPHRVLEGVGEIPTQDGNSNKVLVFSSNLRIKSNRSVVEQKSTEKRPATVLTQRQKDKKARKLGHIRTPILPHNSTKCVTCSRQHPSKECWRCSDKCFNCGKVGHMAVGCRKPWAKPVAKRIMYQGWVYALTNEKTLEAPIVMTSTLFINNYYAELLFDFVPHILISWIFC